MKKGITTDLLFWVIVVLIVIAVFVGIAMWSSEYGLNMLKILPNLIPS